METHELVWVIADALKRAAHPKIAEVSVDGDNDSAEVIVTCADRQEYVISSSDIRVLEDDNE